MSPIPCPECHSWSIKREDEKPFDDPIVNSSCVCTKCNHRFRIWQLLRTGNKLKPAK